MKKHIFLLFLFLILKINAQFVGYYNLRDGGVDMPSSSLVVLPNNEFKIFSYAGSKNGTWKEVGKNEIQLTETKTNTIPFRVFGKKNLKKTDIDVDVYGLAWSCSLIHFSKDTISQKIPQPVFNKDLNCLADDYNIKKKKNEFQWMTLMVPSNPYFKEMKTKYPYKALSYAFLLDEKFSHYKIFFDADALNQPLSFNLTKINDEEYSIGGDRNLEREELTDELLTNIKKAEIAFLNEGLRNNDGEIIHPRSTSKMIIDKSDLKPIFETRCENEKEEPNENQEDKDQAKMIFAERENGFYTVNDYIEDEYDSSKFKLAKEPSLTKNDVLSVNKVVADEGGYEIEIIFTESGKEKLKELTQNNINKPIAIVIDRSIVFAPFINSEISDGKVFINGRFTEKKIDALIENFKK